MIEKKSFFTENNQLNKGYKPERNNYKKPSVKVDLPDSSILAEYEGMQPGTITKMMEMTAKEQEHRHSVEVIQLQMQKTALRMGRLFTIFSVMAICYTSLTMVANNMQTEAMIFAAIGFLAITVAAVVSSCSGRSKKYPHASGGNFNKKPFVPYKKPYQERPNQDRSNQDRSTQPRNNQERPNQEKPQQEANLVNNASATDSEATSSNAKPHYRRRKNSTVRN